METDARPYRAGYSPDFLKRLSSEPRRLTSGDRAAIARAYFLGFPVKALAEQYGISVSHALTIARRYDQQRYILRRQEGEVRAVVEAPAIISPEPVASPLADEPRPGTYTVEKYDHTQPSGQKIQRITLPMLSIQRRAA